MLTVPEAELLLNDLALKLNRVFEAGTKRTSYFGKASADKCNIYFMNLFNY